LWPQRRGGKDAQHGGECQCKRCLPGHIHAAPAHITVEAVGVRASWRQARMPSPVSTVASAKPTRARRASSTIAPSRPNASDNVRGGRGIAASPGRGRLLAMSALTTW
jgi:hypothetical protein